MLQCPCTSETPTGDGFPGLKQSVRRGATDRVKSAQGAGPSVAGQNKKTRCASCEEMMPEGGKERDVGVDDVIELT